MIETTHEQRRSFGHKHTLARAGQWDGASRAHQAAASREQTVLAAAHRDHPRRHCPDRSRRQMDLALRSTAPSLQRTARTYDASAPTSGYSGHASNTHLLSPNWASGIETAWRLSLNAEDKNATVFLYAEGSTLYVTFQSILGPRGPIPRRRMTCPAPSLACCGMRRNRSPRTSTRPHSSSPTRTSCSIPSSFTRQPGGCPTPRGRT